jgi:Carboxypeptidase regulatory-like domain
VKALLALVLAAQVTGTVYTLDGKLVQGAAVSAGKARTTSAKNGTFALRGLPEGVVELVIEKQGLVTAKPLVLAGDRDLTITLYDEATERRDRRPVPPPPLGGTRTIRGVVRLNGQPLPHAHVTLTALTDDDRMPEVTVVANANGAYRATGLQPRRYGAISNVRHVVPVHQRLQVVDVTNADGTLNVGLVASPMIGGRITDADGRPVAHARVEVVVTRHSSIDFTSGDIVRTRPDGRFRVPTPQWSRRDPVVLAVTPPMQNTTRSRPFLLTGRDQDVNVGLLRTVPVRVRVRDAAGKPIANARVAVVGSADRNTIEGVDILVERSHMQRAERTPASGELPMQLAVDRYIFIAAADGFGTTKLERRVDRAGDIVLLLQRR